MMTLFMLLVVYNWSFLTKVDETVMEKVKVVV